MTQTAEQLTLEHEDLQKASKAPNLVETRAPMVQPLEFGVFELNGMRYRLTRHPTTAEIKLIKISGEPHSENGSQASEERHPVTQLSGAFQDLELLVPVPEARSEAVWFDKEVPHLRDFSIRTASGSISYLPADQLLLAIQEERSLIRLDHGSFALVVNDEVNSRTLLIPFLDPSPKSEVLQTEGIESVELLEPSERSCVLAGLFFYNVTQALISEFGMRVELDEEKFPTHTNDGQKLRRYEQFVIALNGHSNELIQKIRRRRSFGRSPEEVSVVAASAPVEVKENGSMLPKKIPSSPDPPSAALSEIQVNEPLPEMATIQIQIDSLDEKYDKIKIEIERGEVVSLSDVKKMIDEVDRISTLLKSNGHNYHKADLIAIRTRYMSMRFRETLIDESCKHAFSEKDTLRFADFAICDPDYAKSLPFGADIPQFHNGTISPALAAKYIHLLGDLALNDKGFETTMFKENGKAALRVEIFQRLILYSTFAESKYSKSINGQPISDENANGSKAVLNEDLAIKKALSIYKKYKDKSEYQFDRTAEYYLMRIKLLASGRSGFGISDRVLDTMLHGSLDIESKFAQRKIVERFNNVLVKFDQFLSERRYADYFHGLSVRCERNDVPLTTEMLMNDVNFRQSVSIARICDWITAEARDERYKINPESKHESLRLIVLRGFTSTRVVQKCNEKIHKAQIDLIAPILQDVPEILEYMGFYQSFDRELAVEVFEAIKNFPRDDRRCIQVGSQVLSNYLGGKIQGRQQRKQIINQIAKMKDNQSQYLIPNLQDRYDVYAIVS